jgi:hypothetical protein
MLCARWFDTTLGNFIFHVSPKYVFSHSQGHDLRYGPSGTLVRLHPKTLPDRGHARTYVECQDRNLAPQQPTRSISLSAFA